MAFRTTTSERAQQIAAKLKQGMITRDEASYLLANPKVNVMSPSAVSGLRSRVTAGQERNLNAANYAKQGSLSNTLRRTNVDHPFMFIFSTYESFVEPSDFGRGSNRMVLPVAPAQFDYSFKNNAQTFTAMSGKTFSHAGAEDLLRISFDTFLPAGLTMVPDTQMPSYVYRNASPASTSDLFEPTEFVEKIQAAQAANQPFMFSIIQSVSTPDGVEIISPTPMTVTDFTPSYSAGQGHDISFSISLQRWNPQGTFVTTGTRVYITKPGDKQHCGNIAQRELRDMTRYKEIKELNKAVLAADYAKRLRQKAQGMNVRTDYITPGTRLLIPANKTPSSGGVGTVPPGTAAPV